MAFKSLAVVDLGQDDISASKSIYEAFTQVGFCYIINHGIPVEFVEKVDGLTREFFAMPDKIKMKMAKKQVEPKNKNLYRGFYPVRISQDYMEGFEIGNETPQFELKKKSDMVYYERNVWPESGNADWDTLFKNTMIEGYAAHIKLGLRIMKLIALAFGIEPAYFERFFEDTMSTYRIQHYPRFNNESKYGKSLTEHVDTSVLTILYQDDFGGLQVQNDLKEWIDVPFIRGSFILNIGRTLEKWTGMKLKATNHRVLAVNGDRYSMPFFFEPNTYVEIAPLPGSKDIADYNGFEPFTYGDFLKQHVVGFSEYQGQIGLY